MPTDAPVSLQRRYFPDMTCFGCGPANPDGLHLSSYEDGDGGTVASFTPWPEHTNGLGYLNGGIICTLLDCHSATPMVLEAVRQGLWSLENPLPFVTAGLDVRYLRPTPLDEPLTLQARLLGATPDEALVEVELLAQDKVRAAGTATWKRWRPRG